MPNPTSAAVSLDDLVAIALAAGEEVLAVYASDFTVETKADASPVTEADRRAEAVILDRLRAVVPDVPVIAEESVAAGIVPEIGDRFFLVDPLDGSKEFIARNGEFTVNIALIEEGVPTLGVVYAPALGQIWWGGVGFGAFHARVIDGRVDVAASIACATAASPRRVVASRSHKTAALSSYLDSLPDAEIVSVGSSLKFCQLAQGTADLYPRFGRTMEWDTAAGDAVLRAAGGEVRDAQGDPLRYGKHNGEGQLAFTNPDFIASVGTAAP